MEVESYSRQHWFSTYMSKAKGLIKIESPLVGTADAMKLVTSSCGKAEF
jgi:hypothetical protein